MDLSTCCMGMHIPLAYFAFNPILNGHRFTILQIWVKCLTNVSSSSEIFIREYLLLDRMDIGETDWAVHFACLGCWCALCRYCERQGTWVCTVHIVKLPCWRFLKWQREIGQSLDWFLSGCKGCTGENLWLNWWCTYDDWWSKCRDTVLWLSQITSIMIIQILSDLSVFREYKQYLLRLHLTARACMPSEQKVARGEL